MVTKKHTFLKLNRFSQTLDIRLTNLNVFSNASHLRSGIPFGYVLVRKPENIPGQLSY